MRHIPGSRRGMRRLGFVLVQLVLCMTALMAEVLAIVLDGGLLMAERRHAQSGRGRWPRLGGYCR